MSLLERPRKVDLAKWTGPKRPYDLVKEGVIAFTVVGILTLGLAGLFSSPDVPALTMKSWATEDAADFAATATGELAGTTTSAGYGAPYNSAAEGQAIGPLAPAKMVGVTIPIDSAVDFVVNPLKLLNDPSANKAVSIWSSVSTSQQTAWASAYADALAKADGASTVADPGRRFGPIPLMVDALIGMAKSGALDGALTTEDSNLPTNFTKPLLFLADSEGYFGDKATAQHLQGDQWGMMNETGSYPGQSWLWLMSFWYQVEPFKSSENADLQIFLLVGILSLGFMLIPFIPGIRRIPYLIPVHRLIWRNYYRKH